MNIDDVRTATYGVDYWSRACRIWVVYIDNGLTLSEAREMAGRLAQSDRLPHRVSSANGSQEHGRWTGEQ